MKTATPNPNGKNGKPISLSDYSFEDVVRKALSTPAPSKHPQTKKKSAKPKRPQSGRRGG